MFCNLEPQSMKIETVASNAYSSLEKSNNMAANHGHFNRQIIERRLFMEQKVHSNGRVEAVMQYTDQHRWHCEQRA